jgi:peptidoglycan/xylan/chitin deacetylase (PgdA/CDA1 family)
LGQGAAAQETAPELPLMIYGNEPELLNNIVLTIDDCANEQLTRQMFDLLVEHNMTATFFPNTVYMTQQDPQLWRDIVDAGFEIGYHTRLHVEGMTEEELAADFALFEDEVRAVLGDETYSINLVRPPYGMWDDSWRAWTEANDLHTVRWNISARARLDMDYVAAIVNNMEQGGRIILLHPRRTDMWWLEAHIEELLALTDEQGQEFGFTTISGAFNDDAQD